MKLVFAKLALENQIDDLLDRFRAFDAGRITTSLAELRRAFDMLVMKTPARLQDDDPLLAGALASSCESNWGDPVGSREVLDPVAAPTKDRAKPRTDAPICAVLLARLLVMPVKAADGAPLLEDLTAVIALLGLPCGQVVSATRLKDDGHIATCQDGSRCRVHIDAEGRAVAPKQQPQPEIAGSARAVRGPHPSRQRTERGCASSGERRRKDDWQRRWQVPIRSSSRRRFLPGRSPVRCSGSG